MGLGGASRGHLGVAGGRRDKASGRGTEEQGEGWGGALGKVPRLLRGRQLDRLTWGGGPAPSPGTPGREGGTLWAMTWEADGRGARRSLGRPPATVLGAGLRRRSRTAGGGRLAHPPQDVTGAVNGSWDPGR